MPPGHDSRLGGGSSVDRRFVVVSCLDTRMVASIPGLPLFCGDMVETAAGGPDGRFRLPGMAYPDRAVAADLRGAQNPTQNRRARERFSGDIISSARAGLFAADAQAEPGIQRGTETGRRLQPARKTRALVRQPTRSKALRAKSG